MIAALPALLYLAVAAPLGGGEASPRYAIVIGHNGAGEEGRAPLTYADDDAARFYLQALPSLRKGWLLTTFDRDSARSFVDLTDIARPPTKSELARVLGELLWDLRESGERGEVVFYFAGHGDVDGRGQGYLVLGDGPFTRSDLEKQVVRGVPGALKHIVIDACASYFMVGRGETTSGRRALTPDLLNALKGRDSGGEQLWTGVLVSTSDAAEVHESGRVGGGVFSYLLRSALAGGADTNGDGRVEYVEAAAFVEAASLEIGDARARLKVHAVAPQQRPHAPLADLGHGGGEHFLTLDDERARHVRVLDARGVPLLEVHRDDESPVTLALIGNPFYIVQVADKEAVLVPRGAGAYALSALDFAKAPSSRTPHDPGLAGLYRQPFGSAFVAGFASRAEMTPPAPGHPILTTWAAGGEPPWRMPWASVGLGLLGAGGAAALAAVGATVGNAVAFAALEERYQYTLAVDPELAVAVEAWRTAAVVATATAALLGICGGAAVAWALVESEELE